MLERLAQRARRVSARVDRDLVRSPAIDTDQGDAVNVGVIRLVADANARTADAPVGVAVHNRDDELCPRRVLLAPGFAMQCERARRRRTLHVRFTAAPREQERKRREDPDDLHGESG